MTYGELRHRSAGRPPVVAAPGLLLGSEAEGDGEKDDGSPPLAFGDVTRGRDHGHVSPEMRMLSKQVVVEVVVIRAMLRREENLLGGRDGDGLDRDRTDGLPQLVSEQRVVGNDEARTGCVGVAQHERHSSREISPEPPDAVLEHEGAFALGELDHRQGTKAVAGDENPSGRAGITRHTRDSAGPGRVVALPARRTADGARSRP